MQHDDLVASTAARRQEDGAGSTELATADSLASALRSRYLADHHWTGLGPGAVISVNPYKASPSDADPVVHEYVAESWTVDRSSSERTTLPPHVWQLACRAFWYMRRTGQDQTIVVTGASGSGKSETRRLAVRALCEAGAPPPGKKGARLVQSVPASEFVYDMFGHAAASIGGGDNASRFGRYTEIQYGDRHRIVGVKGLAYFLDRARVTDVPRGERNFHVLHALVAGATSDEAAHLRLSNVTTGFRYLNNGNSVDLGDAARFAQLKQAFKAIGMPKRAVASACQALATVLHLGQLEFHMDKNKNADAAVCSTPGPLADAASLLAITPEALEAALNVRTRTVGVDRVSAFLDPDGARANADDLARAIYGLLFDWLHDLVNARLSRDDFKTFVSVIDLPGPQDASGRGNARTNGLDALAFNLANERTHAFILSHIFDDVKQSDYEQEGVATLLPGLSAPREADVLAAEGVRLLNTHPGGIVHIIDDQSRRRGKTDRTMLEALGKRWGKHAAFGWRAGDERLGRAGTFSVTHFDGVVTYSTEGMLDANRAAVSTDFVQLLATTSVDPFVRERFGREKVEAQEAVDNGGQLKPSTTLKARPSVRRPKKAIEDTADDDDVDDPSKLPIGPNSKSNRAIDSRCVLGQFNDALTVLYETLKENRLWFAFCLKPNDAGLPNQVDIRVLRAQIGALGIADIARRLDGEWTVKLGHRELWDRFAHVDRLRDAAVRLQGAVWTDKVRGLREELRWTDTDMAIGTSKVYLSDLAFRTLEDWLRETDEVETKIAKEKAHVEMESRGGLTTPDPYSPFAVASTVAAYTASLPHDPSSMSLASQSAVALMSQQGPAGGSTPFDESKSAFFDSQSISASEAYAPSAQLFSEKHAMGSGVPVDEHLLAPETVEVYRTSAARRWWVRATWSMTWWIPDVVLRLIGRIKRPDIRMAWREKLLINMIIWFICGVSVFIFAILGNLVCPTQHVYSTSELQARTYTADPTRELIAIRGEVFDLSKFSGSHVPTVVTTRSVLKYGGTDASDLFPVQVNALCNGYNGAISPWITLTNKTNELNAPYHDFRASTTDYRPDWYYEQMIYLRTMYRTGFMGYTTSEVSSLASSTTTRNTVIYDDGVYDLTSYITNGGGAIVVPPNTQVPAGINREFIHPSIVQIFSASGGSDVTRLINGLGLDGATLQAQKTCLRNLYFIGKVDHRNAPSCKFSQYILLAMSILIVSIIAFKFLAALNFKSSRQPEEYEKFVICQVPCYTEGEDSLRNTLESLAALKYDDKRKLIFVICDGMIVGSGNDRPTPRIVLDILGADPLLDPEPLSFLSLGDGARQHNMGKVYSGLYEHAGHIVPYIVLVKVGKPTEISRPGNRGKRDSQMVLMRFLNRIHFDAPMAPLELEIFHQLKNVVGVDPRFYEFLLSIDADTVVHPLSLTRLVANMMRDRKIIGLCGETEIANKNKSWVSMIQVYEYFISHHLSKAFESLFGSVTCLPGCFSLFRIRTLEGKPLFVANAVVEHFGVNRVDTLHLKNLLHLGEDRYLTTLLMMSFPTYKTSFCRDAYAKTIAPEEWSVLLSQRRRWINSTIHNLWELLYVDRLCGFCLFSMRFIVFIDLMSTIIQPVTIGYIVYLIVLVVKNGQGVPLTAIIMIAAIYGLQAIVFILNRAFEQIGFMIIYILALPIWSLYVPLYSFWKQDDFSWGATRTVQGEKGKKLVIHDEGVFNPEDIPLKRWAEYEEELWEAGSNQSIGSIIAHGRRMTTHDDASLYGAASQFGFGGAGSRPVSRFFDGGAQSRRGSSYPLPTSPDVVESRAPFGTVPSEDQIATDVIQIVSTADLATVSKKTVRLKLEEMYGHALPNELVPWINALIENAALQT